MIRLLATILVMTLIYSCTCSNCKFTRQDQLLEDEETISPEYEMDPPDSLTVVFDLVNEEKSVNDDETTDQEKTPSSGETCSETSNTSFGNNLSKETKSSEVPQNLQNGSGKSNDKLERDRNSINHSVTIQSWNLENREPLVLQLPNSVNGATGNVTVIIKVDRQGNVVFAEVDPSVSTVNVELKENARKAAKSSKFSVSSDSQFRQTGIIVYSFE